MADDEDTWQNRLGVAFEGALKASPVIGPLVNATINPLTGERYQLWPEQMIRSGATLPGDVYSGKVPTLLGMRREDYTDIPQDLQPSDTWLGSKLGLREGKELGPSSELIARTQDLSGMAGGSAFGTGIVKGFELNALGVVPVPKAKALNVKTGAISEELVRAVENTPGAKIDEDGHLIVNVKRTQHPDQEMAESVRGGVFYQPAEGSYSYNGRSGYGGSQKIEGETAYKNPLTVKGATGGKAPEMAYDQLLGKGAYQKMRNDALASFSRTDFGNVRRASGEKVGLFLEKYAPELSNHADYIIENSQKGNQLAYALQEAAVASAVRNAGHDGVIGYSIRRGQYSPDYGKPFISEIFDVRENRYPSPSGDYSIHPQFLSDTSANAPLSALAKPAPRFYSALENAVKDSNTKVASADQWLGELRNKPGVKQEELDWVLHDLPDGKIGKAELEQFVNEHKVELKEVSKGGPPAFTKDDIMAKAIDLANAKGKRFSQLSREQKADLLADAEDQLLTNSIVGNNSPETKYSQWQLPGGSNYSERLLTLPQKTGQKPIIEKGPFGQYQISFPDGNFEGGFTLAEAQKAASEFDLKSKHAIEAPQFTSSHWNEPNVLAHIRTNERAIPGVGNSLHIEEIQSDWHQAGRKQGYKGEKEELQPKFDKIEQKILDSNDEAIMANPELKDALKMAVDKGIITKDEANIYQRYSSIESGSPVPDAPFKSNWADLSLKRIIRQAAEEGKDSISWTPGEAQAARYDLSKHISDIHYSGSTLKAYDHGGNKIMDETGIKPEELANYIGKEAAEKLLAQPKEKGVPVGWDYTNSRQLRGEAQSLSGLDLKVGGEGMKAFYDKMLADKANAIAKKFGGKVEQDKITETSGGKYAPVHVLRLTPQLRDAALNKGFSLFADTGKVGAPLAALTRVEHNPFKLAEMEKQHGVKLTPVDENPFTTDAYHGTRGFKGTEIEPKTAYDIHHDTSTGKSQYRVWDTVNRRYISPSFNSKEIAADWLSKRVGSEFFSTPNSELASDYAGYRGGQVLPLKLNTKDYHTFDAKGREWQSANTQAIFEANQLNKKGVIVKNVVDNAGGFDFGPQTVYITLDPSTVRSKFAKFDPAKYGESGLLKASGLPIYSDDKGNELMPPPPNPARIAAIEPPATAIATIGAKAAEWGLFALARNSPRLFASLNAAWGAQLPMLVSQFMMDDIRKQVREGKAIKDIKFEEGSLADAFGLFSSLEKKYGKLAGHLRPVEGNPFANQ